MNIKLKNTPDQKELMRRLGSKNKMESAEASEALAAVLGPIIQTVLNQASTQSMIYTDWPYGEYESPEFPLDIFWGQIDNYIPVWFQSIAGGIPPSHMTGTQTLNLTTFEIDSAVSMLKRYTRSGRVNVVGMVLNRLSQELLQKQERQAHAVLLKALAEAGTNTYANKGLSHVISANLAGTFQLHDLNALMTRMRRIYTSFSYGTPADGAGRITDLLVSPEIMEDVRGFAYQPMNTRAVPNTDESTAVPLPDSVREGIFNNPNAQEIYGVGLTELNEYGVGEKYNALFDSFYAGTFVPGTSEIVVGLDLSRQYTFLRPVEEGETGSQVSVESDGDFWSRSKKLGWISSVQQGNVILDARSICGLIV